MSSRDDILTAIRSKSLEPTPLPTLEQDWIQYDDPLAQFAASLELVGGQCIRVATLEDVSSELTQLPQFESAKVRCSTIDGLGNPTLDLNDVSDPHDLETIDFALLSGEFAVAENGAVWITDEGLPHRVQYFISQHTALVVAAKDVVHNMHEAYQRLSLGDRRFGAFISGPSKTADIEQSLVIGAHGPRSHVVFLVDALS